LEKEAAWEMFTSNSQKEKDIEQKGCVFSAMDFLIGSGALLSLSIDKFISVVGMLAVTIIFYKHYKRLRIHQEAKSIAAEKEDNLKQYKQAEEAKSQRIQAQAIHEAEQLFAQYRMIRDSARKNGILLWVYYTYDYPPDWEVRVQRVQKRDKFRCRSCQSVSRVLQVHHIIPVGKGGTHHLHNLTTLCRGCHLKEHPWIVTNNCSTTTKQRTQSHDSQYPIPILGKTFKHKLKCHALIRAVLIHCNFQH